MKEGWPLGINGKEIDANRHNTSLFNFLGRNACFDHIFIVVSEEENNLSGCYIFAESPREDQKDLYKRMRPFMIKHKYPAHLNLQDVAECDTNAFFASSLWDLEHAEYLPKEWDGTQPN